jgi:hypothetical protein
LQSLPAGVGGEGWQTAKMWCIKEKLLYEECVTSLEAFERPPALPEGSANQYASTTVNTTISDANTATHKNRSLRTKNDRPDLKRNTRSTRSSTNKRPRRDPSPSPSGDSSDSDSSIPSIDFYSSRCRFCGREGHIQYDCHDYNKGRRRSHRKHKKSKGGVKQQESPHIHRSARVAMANRTPSPSV